MPLNLKIHNQFEQWLHSDALVSCYSAQTLKMYRWIILSFINYLLGKRISKLNDIDTGFLHQFIAFKPNKKPYAPASINQRIAALDLFFTWAYELNYCRTNPVLAYKKSKLQPRPLKSRLVKVNLSTPNFLNDTEINNLFHQMQKNSGFFSLRDAAIIELILASGLYAEEIINLEFKNLNIKKGVVKIRGEGKRERNVNIENRYPLTFCKQWIKCRQKFLGKGEHTLLFFTQRMKPMTKALLYQQISFYLQKAKIHKSQKGPDILRQTAIFNMLKSGITVEQVQANIGHKHLLSLERYLK